MRPTRTLSLALASTAMLLAGACSKSADDRSEAASEAAASPATDCSARDAVCSRDGDVAVIATRAPRSSNRRAMARPIPREPPVTKATLPVSMDMALLQYTAAPTLGT